MTEKELIKEAIYYELYDKTKAVALISVLNDIITRTSIDIASYRIKNGHTAKLAEPVERVALLKQVRDGLSSYYTDYEALRLEERKVQRTVKLLAAENKQLREQIEALNKSFTDL